MESILYTRIKELCESRGISMAKLSEDLGIAASLIRKWKTTTSPSVDRVKMIAEYFGVSVDYLHLPLNKLQNENIQTVCRNQWMFNPRCYSIMRK